MDVLDVCTPGCPLRLRPGEVLVVAGNICAMNVTCGNVMGDDVGLPGRIGYGHSGNGSDRDNRLDSMAFTADGKLVFADYMCESDDGASC